eukprot:3504022-Prymnesium_polylepis.1
MIGWDAPAAVQPLSAPRPPHVPAVPGARRCSRGAPAHGVGAALGQTRFSQNFVRNLPYLRKT